MTDPSADSLVTRQNSNGIAILTLNRPDKLNALNVGCFESLASHVSDIASQTGEIGCVLLRGAGRCFSAGHDLNDIGEGEHPPVPDFQARTIEQLANLPQPVVSAVHGHCYTGALELALAGDIILASSDVRFADTHAKWSLTPRWGGSQRLPIRVGKHVAAELMHSCRTVHADEALRIGLCNHVFDSETFEANVLEYCDQMLTNSWFSLNANKRLLNETDGMSLAQGLAHEIYRGAGRGPDAAERVAKFTKS